LTFCTDAEDDRGLPEGVASMAKSLLCRLGMHQWKWISNEDGGRFKRCARCGKDEDGTRQGGGAAW
jgi:hypothetical protein